MKPLPLPAIPEEIEDPEGGAEDLLEALGVKLPEKPRAEGTKPSRHTEWSNAGSFRDGGYIARVRAQRCAACGQIQEFLEGVFHCEINPSGARRLQRLTDRAQVPLDAKHVMEYTEEPIPACPSCLMAQGFTEIIEAPRAYTLTIG